MTVLTTAESIPVGGRGGRPSVLLVCRGFPPYIRSLGGAMRMLKLAEYLDRQGWNVHVVAAAGPRISTFGYDALLERLSITYVPDLALRRAAVGVEHESGMPERARMGGLRRARSMAKNLVLEACTPDVGILSLRQISRAAADIVRKKGVRRVITSGPPHSDHLVGLHLKRQCPDVRWIVDYRDSWNSTPIFRKKFPPLQWFNRALEERVLSRCDAFTYVSEPMLTKLLSCPGKLPGLEEKATLVRNGFDADMLQDSVASEAGLAEGAIVLGYFGSVSDESGSYRNPTSLLQALEDNPDIPLRLEFYGAARIDAQWRKRLGDRLHIGGALSHEKALAKMSTMHGLLLLHTEREGADEVVTGKVFEYIASRRPILSVGPENMAVNGILEDDRLSRSASHEDEQALVSSFKWLVGLYEAADSMRRSRQEMIGFTRQAQYLKLVELLAPSGAQAGAN